jgi:bacterioferritin (cytochrome b1)
MLGVRVESGRNLAKLNKAVGEDLNAIERYCAISRGHENLATMSSKEFEAHSKGEKLDPLDKLILVINDNRELVAEDHKKLKACLGIKDKE